MSKSPSKEKVFSAAYENGVRRCPCCNVQLTWKICGPSAQKNLATVDHIIPKSHGGTFNQENLFVMCYSCNMARGVKCFVEFTTNMGLSKEVATKTFETAAVCVLSCLIHRQFTNYQKKNNDTFKKYRAQIREIAASLEKIDANKITILKQFM